MHLYYFFLLLLLVLSVYSESPQHANTPPIEVTAHSNTSSAHLGILTPVLPQHEVYRTTPPHNEVSKTTLPHNEVYKTILPHNEDYRTVWPQNKVLKNVVPQKNVFKIIFPENEVFKIVIVNCQVFKKVKSVIDYLLNVVIKSSKFLPSTLIHAGEKIGWSIRILLESLQHVLKMYTWSLSENQASIQFKCRLIGLLLKQSLFRKHDFAACVYRVYHDYQSLCCWHFTFFSNSRNNSHSFIREDDSEKLTRFHFHGGGKALIFSSNEL